MGHFVALLFSLLAISLNFCQTTPHKVHLESERVTQFALEHLPQEGVLMRNPDGYVYLKVDDDYIYALYPLLDIKKEGFREPPYFRRKNSPGAHISIFYAKDDVNPQELGQKIHFTPLRVVSVKNAKAQYIVLEVHAPEIEKLREKYGYPPRLKGKEFHITIAKKFLKRHLHPESNKNKNHQLHRFLIQN